MKPYRRMGAGSAHFLPRTIIASNIIMDKQTLSLIVEQLNWVQTWLVDNE